MGGFLINNILVKGGIMCKYRRIEMLLYYWNGYADLWDQTHNRYQSESNEYSDSGKSVIVGCR